MGLSIKQEKFCNYYIECGNASEAYRRAYSCSNMKDESINVKAFELLNNGKITVRVKELQEELKKKSDITKEEVLNMLRSFMYADIRNFLTIKDGNVTFKDSEDWTDEMAMQVESVKQGKDGIEIKLNGRTWTIQRICKMLGFDSPQDVNVNMISPMTKEEAKRIIEDL
ncbi:terminase small subunit [Bacteroides thetaiotaomicron]|jgi:phage terminase small subunit|uniref:terminase small subunit n=1 Tax=Bacteroides TaxID=816 RepID=UPI00204E9822|nr:MAG TPA: Terminase small subunit [Caudoviricetes sp.]